MTAKSTGFILLLLTLAAAAQAPDPGERFYQAIRNDDLTTLRALVKEAGVDAKDRQGQTPLILAAAFGSAEVMRLLLASGADVRAVSSAGVTALHWAAPSAVKVQLLLEAGADVNVVTQLGRTPLLIAASSNGGGESVRLLLQKGAKIAVTDGIGMTPLTAAALVNDTEVVKLLVAKGAPVEVPSANGAATTPLMAAATNGNLEAVRLLLAHGATPNAVSIDSANKVKNGPIAFGRMTALHFAVLSGNADVVQQLITAGADIDRLDVRGMTPLMMAIATDRPDLRIVRMLVDAGANTSLRSTAACGVCACAATSVVPVEAAAIGVAGRSFSAASTPGC